jgi:hypothetical protein
MKKKTTEPATKKPAQKKPATKTPPSRPKRKAEGQSELTPVVARLEAIANQLMEAAERLAEAAKHLAQAARHTEHLRPGIVDRRPHTPKHEISPTDLSEPPAQSEAEPMGAGEGADVADATREE